MIKQLAGDFELLFSGQISANFQEAMIISLQTDTQQSIDDAIFSEALFIKQRT